MKSSGFTVSNDRIVGRPSERTVLGVGLPPLAGWLSVWLSLVSVVCCQTEVSSTARSLIQRSPTESCVSVCNPKTSTMRRPRPEWGCCDTGKTWQDYRKRQLKLMWKGLVVICCKVMYWELLGDTDEKYQEPHSR